MKVVVYGCFHWIGFQFVEHLLNEGYEIFTTDSIDHPNHEYFYELIGRNANFHLVKEGEINHIEVEDVYHFYDEKRYICSLKKNNEFHTNVYLSEDVQLIGKYMPEDRTNKVESAIEVDIFIKWLARLTECNLLKRKYVIIGDIG